MEHRNVSYGLGLHHQLRITNCIVSVYFAIELIEIQQTNTKTFTKTTEIAVKGFSQITKGILTTFEQYLKKDRLQQSVTSLEEGLRGAIHGHNQQSEECAIQYAADKAADNVDKQAIEGLVLLAIIVITIVVAPELTEFAVAGAVALGASEAVAVVIADIAVGIFIGVVSGVINQLINNAIEGKKWSDDLGKAAIIGAISGALGGVGGRFGGKLAQAVKTEVQAAKLFLQDAIRFGIDQVFNIIGTIFGDIATGEKITGEGILSAVEMGALGHLVGHGIGGVRGAANRGLVGIGKRAKVAEFDQKHLGEMDELAKLDPSNKEAFDEGVNQVAELAKFKQVHHAERAIRITKKFDKYRLGRFIKQRAIKIADQHQQPEPEASANATEVTTPETTTLSEASDRDISTSSRADADVTGVKRPETDRKTSETTASGKRSTHYDEPEIEQGVVAKEKTADGHETKVLKDGRIFSCTTCKNIRDKHKEILELIPDLLDKLNDIEKRVDPKVKAEEATQLDIEIRTILAHEKILGFTHETTPENLLNVLENEGLKSRAKLEQEGRVKPNQDTKRGGGYYVYTRMIVEGNETKLGGGSKGAGGQIMLILKPDLASRKDWFMNSTDLAGFLPTSMIPTDIKGFPKEWELLNQKEAFRRGVGRGKMTEEFGEANEFRTPKIEGLIKQPVSAHQEQGFFERIGLESFEKIIVKQNVQRSKLNIKQEITGAEELIKNIRSKEGLEEKIRKATGVNSLEEFIVDEKVGKPIRTLMGRLPESHIKTISRETEPKELSSSSTTSEQKGQEKPSQLRDNTEEQFTNKKLKKFFPEKNQNMTGAKGKDPANQIYQDKNGEFWLFKGLAPGKKGIYILQKVNSSKATTASGLESHTTVPITPRQQENLENSAPKRLSEMTKEELNTELEVAGKIKPTNGKIELPNNHELKQNPDGLERCSDQCANISNQLYEDITQDVNFSLNENNYIERLETSINRNDRIAYVVNAILPYTDVERIPQVIESIKRESVGFQDRIAFVFGINAQESKENAMENIINTVQEQIENIRVPIGIVFSTYKGKKFPYGRMRNEVMHSQETRNLLAAFTNKNLHPYISIQDFDIGARTVPSGEHIFNFFENQLKFEPEETGSTTDKMDIENQLKFEPEETGFTTDKMDIENQPDLRPLMMTGGYRAGLDLIEEMKNRFSEGEIPEQLTNAESTFSSEFAEAVKKDMLARERLSKIHPLLPYAPEPNLFISGLPFLLDNKIAFGPMGAEFTNLAKTINKFLAFELQQYYEPRYKKAPQEIPVKPIKFIPKELDENNYNWPKEEEKIEVKAGEEFLPEDEQLQLEQDQIEIKADLESQAQTNAHPLRGKSFLTEFIKGSIETDLFRLANFYLQTGGKLPQSHDELTGVVDRFFRDKTAKKDTKLAVYRDEYRSHPSSQREPLTTKLSQNNNTWSLKLKHQNKWGNRKNNMMSEAISLSYPQNSPFHGVEVGIPQKHKLYAAHATSTSSAQDMLFRNLAFVQEELLGGIPLDGNCLYHAVNQARTGYYSIPEAMRLREQVITWVLNESHLPVVADYAFQQGVDLVDLIQTISRNGNWGGNAGDLVPRLVASTLNRTIVIHQNGTEIQVSPLVGESNQTIHLKLENNHYTLYEDTSISSLSHDSSDVMDIEP